jgi:hypothetical protein
MGRLPRHARGRGKASGADRGYDGRLLLSVRGGRVVRLATFTDRAEAAESRRGYLSSERPFADDGGGRSSVRRYPGLPVDKIVTV